MIANKMILISYFDSEGNITIQVNLINNYLSPSY